jgi:diguanylate cyclase (GGDEF)-like protein/PAS domain S-box-containing protein
VSRRQRATITRPGRPALAGESRLRRRRADRDDQAAILRATLDNMDQGLLLVASDGTILVWNKRALDLLDLPASLIRRRPHFSHVLEFQFARGDYQRTDSATQAWFKTANVEQTQHTYERQTRTGRYLEIRSVPAPNGGMLRTYSDITDRKLAELARRAAEREYRSLFENAVVGIYRARLDGTKLRANTGLVRICGFATEEELLASERPGRTWYKDKGRAAEFMQRLKERGRVDDFVSEVYRGPGRERIWVSETAWLVPTADGETPCYEGMVIDTTERKLSEARIAYLARHDPLTDLPNRTQILDHLSLRLSGRDARSVTVLCLDLDRFKTINDTLGHPIGDDLLRVVSDRIRQVAGPRDMVGRFGGDEFVIVHLGTIESAKALAARALEAIAQPMIVQTHRMAVGVSIGIATSDGQIRDPNQILKSADLALYDAKSAGRNTFRVYETGMDTVLEARRRVELGLRDALMQSELVLHYQPIMRTLTRKVTSVEALVRWQHPTRGLIGPGEFIGIAEETGLIVPIGNWVVRRACLDAAAWRDDLAVSVNISPMQFRHGDVYQQVMAALAESKLSPRRLHLEITETALIHGSDGVADTLHRLRAEGVSIALDDFGTGFSSLSYLRTLPLDKIKIDRSFTRDMTTDERTLAIVRAILGMGQHLGFTTIAEGVETPEQFRLLLAEGCAEVQGFLLGHAAPVAALTDLLTSAETRLVQAA